MRVAVVGRLADHFTRTGSTGPVVERPKSTKRLVLFEHVSTIKARGGIASGEQFAVEQQDSPGSSCRDVVGVDRVPGLTRRPLEASPVS